MTDELLERDDDLQRAVQPAAQDLDRIISAALMARALSNRPRVPLFAAILIAIGVAGSLWYVAAPGSRGSTLAPYLIETTGDITVTRLPDKSVWVSDGLRLSNVITGADTMGGKRD